MKKVRRTKKLECQKCNWIGTIEEARVSIEQIFSYFIDEEEKQKEWNGELLSEKYSCPHCENLLYTHLDTK